MALAPGIDEHGRGDAEGGDAVDADAVRAKLAGGVLGEAEDGVLGGGVGVAGAPGRRGCPRRRGGTDEGTQTLIKNEIFSL